MTLTATNVLGWKWIKTLKKRKWPIFLSSSLYMLNLIMVYCLSTTHLKVLDISFFVLLEHFVKEQIIYLASINFVQFLHQKLQNPRDISPFRFKNIYFLSEMELALNEVKYLKYLNAFPSATLSPLVFRFLIREKLKISK